MTTDEWVEADHLLAQVVPAVLHCSSVEEKNTTLCELIYNILIERFGVKPLPRTCKSRQGRSRQHDRALKRVTELKNAARQALRRAKRKGGSAVEVHARAGEFLSLLRDHSKLKKESEGRFRAAEMRSARTQCHRHFWRFAKDLLDESPSTSTPPAFSQQDAHDYFSTEYSSQPHHFTKPAWMPSPANPVYPMSSLGPVTRDELTTIIRRSRSLSSPSPLDQIPYQIFKKCPSLVPALLDLFNSILAEGTVPSSWKNAVFKLIGKSASKENPKSPSNFRPIALTSRISKLFSGILKDRWLKHMVSNGYLNAEVQKAFLPTIPGVTEHQCKLAAIIKEAKRSKHSLVVTWLDIANAYGSVHHSLIQFALQHYHAPPRALQSPPVLVFWFVCFHLYC